MHNLRRVAAGLSGEYLEPERTPEPEEDDDAVFGGVSKGKTSGKDRKGGKSGKSSKTTDDDEWQDMAEYEREEGVVAVGEVGTRTTVVQEDGEEPEAHATSGAQDTKRKRDTVDGEAFGKLSKEARKKAKKEKNQQRKRNNEKKRAGKGE